MQADLLQHAERVLGPCNHGFTIEPARFVTGAEACAIRINKTISISLEFNAARDWEYCAAILGHEVVHAWDGLLGPPSWLEEGVACAFGIGQCAAWYGRVPGELVKCSYRRALGLAASVPDMFGVVRSLRAQGFRLGGVIPSQLMAAAPGVCESLAESLCARFEQPKVFGHARLYNYGDLRG